MCYKPELKNYQDKIKKLEYDNQFNTQHTDKTTVQINTYVKIVEEQKKYLENYDDKLKH